jgi:hypothetical protein
MKNTIATQINRNFYRNLKDIGHSDEYIMNIIQSNRKVEFYNDILPYLTCGSVKNITLWNRLINKLKLKKW